MTNNILTREELLYEGFVCLTATTFFINKYTKYVTTNNDVNGVAKLTNTFLLGEEKEWDIKLYDINGVKKRAIDQMKKIGIKWVYNVYYGEIYIPKNQTNGDRYHNIFARASI